MADNDNLKKDPEDWEADAGNLPDSQDMVGPEDETEVPDDTYEKSKHDLPGNEINQQIDTKGEFDAVKDANEMLEDPYGDTDLSYDHLLELAEENSPEAEEELKALAERFNIVVTDADTPHDLAMKIYQASENEADNEMLS